MTQTAPYHLTLTNEAGEMVANLVAPAPPRFVHIRHGEVDVAALTDDREPPTFEDGWAPVTTFARVSSAVWYPETPDGPNTDRGALYVRVADA
jgi:hypothetical protein